jgi:hypothetical protein
MENVTILFYFSSSLSYSVAITRENAERIKEDWQKGEVRFYSFTDYPAGSGITIDMSKVCMINIKRRNS